MHIDRATAIWVSVSAPRCWNFLPMPAILSLSTSLCSGIRKKKQSPLRWLKVRDSTFNRLTPNDPYMGRTAPLTSKRCILYICLTNVGTEYFKHALYSPFFSSSKCSLFHNVNLFGSYIIHILYTGCAEIKKKIISAPKG